MPYYYLLVAMKQTPYEMLLKKAKQRKFDLFNNPEDNHFKYRSISSNTKLPNQLSEKAQTKTKEKCQVEKQARMNFSSCLKKSYYYRKFLNKSAEGQLTQEQFHKIKDTFSKIRVYHCQTEQNPFIFRQIWENQIKKKCSVNMEQKELQLMGKSKQTEKSLGKLPITFAVQKKIENITEIAQKRKKCLVFDLEILGNKKNIKVKTKKLSQDKKSKTIKNILEKELKNPKTELLESSDNKVSYFEHMAIRTEQSNFFCTPFKRFQQTVGSQLPSHNQKVQIKISQTFPEQRRQNTKANEFKSLCLDKDQQSGQCIEQRNTISSWNYSSQPQNERYYRLQSSQKCRMVIRRHKKVILGSNYTNDIQGWNVRAENQEENNQMFRVQK